MTEIVTVDAAGVSLPMTYPSSMLLEVIEDADVLALLDEEDTLRARRTELRTELRGVQEEKMRLQRSLQPQLQQHFDDTAASMAALQQEKDALYAELNAVRGAQDATAQARKELRSLTAELRELRRVISLDTLLLRDEERELDFLQSSPVTSKLTQQQRLVEKHRATVRERSGAVQEKEAELQRRSTELQPVLQDAVVAAQNERFNTLRQQLHAAQEKIAVARQQRQDRRPDTAPVRALDARVEELHAALQAVETRLRHVHHTLLPCTHFTYAPTQRAGLIGGGGATLRQLQRDFGVAVCLDTVPIGHGFMVGPTVAMQQCAAAVAQLLREAEGQSVCTERLSFDPALTRHVVGPHGAHIAALERQSGARLRVRDDAMELTGHPDAIATARRLLENFLASFTTDTLSFAPSKLALVLGKGGHTIQRVQRETGVRGLVVDRVRHVLTATGTPEAVAAALGQYRALLDPTTSHTAAPTPDHTRLVLRGSPALVRAVIGTGGSRVRALETTTQARVRCEEDGSVVLTGTDAAVQAARDAIEALRRVEREVAIELGMGRFLTTAVVLDDTHSTSSPPRSRSASVHDTEDGTAANSSTTPVVVYLSPLQAIRRVTRCSVVQYDSTTGTVRLRGRPESVSRAETMLRQLLLHNPLHVATVPYPAVLRPLLLGTARAGSHAPSDTDGPQRRGNVLEVVRAAYSPLLHIDLDHDHHVLRVSSQDAAESTHAAAELATRVHELSARHVRTLPQLPLRLTGSLIGPKGEHIRALERESGTEVAVMRGAQTAEVQVLSREGNAADLDCALAAIRARLGLEPVTGPKEDAAVE